ncbi:MAG: GTPase Era [Ruminococcus sp.]|jgi:GTP-binding protein Era|nr:GTPase Era [Ruminococcus sp.]
MNQTVFITLTGKTNAGKSTLLNKLIGEHIAAVSPKPNTTLTNITGIITEGSTQFVFIDTPGGNFETNNADVLLYVHDIKRKFSDRELESIAKIKIPVILLISKVDLVGKDSVAKFINYIKDKQDFASIIPVSVVDEINLNIIKKEIKKFAKEAHFYYDPEKFTDQDELFITSEFIREKCLYFLRDEIPHNIEVKIEKFTERTKKEILDISAVIVCEKKNHKGIIIGKDGEMLKRIATEARLLLEEFFKIKVNLEIYVKSE